MNARRSWPIGFVGVALVVAGACGSSGDSQTDTATTLRPDRFPAAVVSAPTTRSGTSATTSTTGRRKTKASATTTTSRVTTGTTRTDRVAPAPTALPVPRTEVGSTSWNGLAVIAGGFDQQGEPSARVDFYNPDDGTWAKGPDLPVALHDLAIAAVGNDLWVVGGFVVEGNQWIAQASTYHLAAGDTKWTPGPNLHIARGALGLTTVGSTLVALGGLTTDGGPLDSVESLAPGDDAWKGGPPLAQKRAYTSATAVDGRVLAIGGRLDKLTTNLTSVESWKPGEDVWRDEPNLNDARSGAAAAGGCVAGGENPDGPIGTIECFTAGHWTTRFHMAEPRHGEGAAAIDGYLHVIGGSPTSGQSESPTHEVFAL